MKKVGYAGLFYFCKMKLKELLAGYDTVIFDLGGVVLDLHYEATIEAFQALGAENFAELYSQVVQTDLFDRYETGQISSMHFVNKMKELLPDKISPNGVVSAWNAMIKEFQPGKLVFLEQLMQTHTTALLSNTNDLHMDCVRRKLKKVTGKPLEAYFRHTFLSQELNMRKPHRETFLSVCERMAVAPERVLFIDDSPQHVEGAKEAGLNAVLFPRNHPFL